MRGTPWLRFAVMACALGLMAIPVWRLTRAGGPSKAALPMTTSPAMERDLTLEIESVPAAESIGVSYLGRELIPEAKQGGSYSGTIRLPVAPADLVVVAQWSGSQMAALRVRVSDESGPVAEASYWGTDRIEDVLTVPESQQ
jgi:hypothetical protein